MGGGFVEIQMGDSFRKSTIKKGERLVNAEHVFNLNEAVTAYGAELTGTVIKQTKVGKNEPPYRVSVQVSVK